VTEAPSAPKAPKALDALEALRRGIEAARVLGLDVREAEAVAAEAAKRVGIVPDAYVLALVGGTGVGKSSILNAIAGREVSRAGPRRPTTANAVAWVSGDGDVGPLIEHLGVERAAGGGTTDPGSVVVLDLPDVDSVDASHRERVEAILPRVDVVAWVTDPEKYADSVLHDDFVRSWLPRLDRQIVILNKADRLTADDLARVRSDLGALVAREAGAGGSPPSVVSSSAIDGSTGVQELRAWIGTAADAKSVVAARLVAGARAAVAELARAAGVLDDPNPILSRESRSRAIDTAIEDTLRVVDLPGLERQAVAATRARARRRGTGVFGLLTSSVFRLSGRERRVADPASYLRSWRSRGGLARAVEALRRSVVEVLGAAPPGIRPVYAAAAESAQLERLLARSTDEAIARTPPLEAPSSRIWSVLGLLQTANTLVLAVAVVWLVIWILVRPPVATLDVPLFGPVPAPIGVLAAAIVFGYVVARVLGLHAGWLGGRWARRIAANVRAAVREAIAAEGYRQVDALDRACAELHAAWISAR
jgi:50S ribosome-binding GTPase